MLVVPSLKLWLRMEGNANDNSGNGHNGTVNGATLAVGKFGRCYSFDGTDDNISIPPMGDLPTFTYCLWMNGVPNTTKQQRIIDCKTATRTANIAALLVSDADGAYGSIPMNSLAFLNYTTTNNINVVWDAAWSNVWIFVTVTWDTSNVVKLYVNAVEKASGTLDATELLARTGTMFGASISDGTTYASSFSKDEIMIFSKALSQSDLRRVMLGLHPLNG